MPLLLFRGHDSMFGTSGRGAIEDTLVILIQLIFLNKIRTVTPRTVALLSVCGMEKGEDSPMGT